MRGEGRRGEGRRGEGRRAPKVSATLGKRATYERVER
jgi:hypothetical protein